MFLIFSQHSHILWSPIKHNDHCHCHCHCYCHCYCHCHCHMVYNSYIVESCIHHMYWITMQGLNCTKLPIVIHKYLHIIIYNYVHNNVVFVHDIWLLWVSIVLSLNSVYSIVVKVLYIKCVKVGFVPFILNTYTCSGLSVYFYFCVIPIIAIDIDDFKLIVISH